MDQDIPLHRKLEEPSYHLPAKRPENQPSGAARPAPESHPEQRPSASLHLLLDNSQIRRAAIGDRVYQPHEKALASISRWPPDRTEVLLLASKLLERAALSPSG